MVEAAMEMEMEIESDSRRSRISFSRHRPIHIDRFPITIAI